MAVTCQGIDAGLLIQCCSLPLYLVLILAILTLDGIDCWLELLDRDGRLYLHFAERSDKRMCRAGSKYLCGALIEAYLKVLSV